MKQFVLVIFIVFICNLNAQIDTNYIRPIKNNMTIGFDFGGLKNNFNIESSFQNYKLRSNLVPNFGIWFKYKELPSISISVPVSEFNLDSLSKSMGLNFSIKFQVSDRVILDGYVFFLKGFDLNEITRKGYFKSMYRTYDLNMNLDFHYVFNYKKFSYKNAYIYGETQKKSASTFTAGFTSGYVHLSTQMPLFENVNFTNNNIDFQSVRAFSFSVLGGYLHTVVFGKENNWFINGGFFLGPNIHFGTAKYHNGQEGNDFFNVGYNAKYKASFGYNINKITIKMFSNGNFISYKPSLRSFIANNIYDFKIGSIYRF